ncbi:serine protease Do [Alkalispirochaeta americana]|uniref:Serine protease Do n=1 Tax=Alkalispirochaeta americana TaxID=159291 RepID=A0A1N6V974_9SPIO|nr:Do family serine endopeptidase [Alkalispirochaeta americana]SIQ74424.1 serine protease Do [Alkalispirochaeta americana]
MKKHSLFGVAYLVLALLPGTVAGQSRLDPMTVMEAQQETLRRVSQEVLPVVVEVEVVQRVTRRTMPRMSPFDFFFGRPDPENREQQREFEQRGIGSGIIVRRVDEKVYVLSNDHVIGKAEEINITLHDGRTFKATRVGSDPNTDLALAMFETDQDIPLAVLGDSDTVQVGDFALAVGNPLGFESTVTSGIISAVGRQGPQGQRIPVLTDYIQTDAAINRGNSGGPLVNLRGEVIGINTWIASQTGGSIGLGFAIPVNVASRAINQFIETGSAQYGWLGVNMADPPESPSNSLRESEGGAIVYNLYSGSPAEEAGLRPGDIIVSVGDETIRTSNDLLRAVTRLDPGVRTRFGILREGTRQDVFVRTGSRPSDGEATSPANLWPGMSVVEMTDSIRENLDLSSRDGAVIIGQVSSGSPAAMAGLRSGDIILRVNNTGVSTLREFYRELNRASVADDEVLFRVRRNDTNLIIGLVR